jgi:peroxiredoxin
MYIKWITWGLLGLLFMFAFLRPPPGGLQLDILAPQFSAKLQNETEFRLEDHRGQVVVLDFWATWCPPCRRSLPALSKLVDLYKTDTEVWIGTVNSERISKASLKKWMKKMRVEFPVIRDQTNVISRLYNVSSLPTLIIINKQGKIHQVQVGLTSSHPPTLVKHITRQIEDARSK